MLKSGILRALEENRDRPISGQALAERFGVSRSAVWKAMAALKEEGYEILSATNRGYMLAADCDRLSPEGIAAWLSPRHRGLPVEVFQSIDSTNNEAKRRLAGGSGETALIAAEEQTAGRGRLGRSFYSPGGTGLYMTLAIGRARTLRDPTVVTIAAAVAAARSVEALTGKQARIKWVNDIYMEGRKVCGILCEAVTDFVSGTVESVVIGIGVNVRTGRFPEELRAKAGALDTPGLLRCRLAARIADELLDILEQPEEHRFLADYRARSLVLGREVTFLRNGTEQKASAVAVDDAGGLLVRYADGREETLRSGEVSVRLPEGSI